MRQRVDTTVARPPGAVFDFVARDHWRNHPRWDPDVAEIRPLDPGPIRAGSRARVLRSRGPRDAPLEVIEFEPDARWVSRTEIGPFTLLMTASIEPVGPGRSRLTLVAETQARGAIRHLLPVLAPLFRRRMRASLERIKELVESETPSSGGDRPSGADSADSRPPLDSR